MLPRSMNISAMHCFVSPFMLLGYTSYDEIWQVYWGAPIHVNMHFHV
jgi:hypothetical protein